MSRWIAFIPRPPMSGRKTQTWEVITKDTNFLIGLIHWHGQWRQYSLYPEPDCIFEKTCLRDIADFCEAETRKHFETSKRAVTA